MDWLLPFVQNTNACGLPEVLSLGTFLSQRNKQIVPPSSHSTFSPFISIIKIHHVSSKTKQQHRSKLPSLDVTDLKVKPQFCWGCWNANTAKQRDYFPFLNLKYVYWKYLNFVVKIDSKPPKLRLQYELCHVACLIFFGNPFYILRPT